MWGNNSALKRRRLEEDNGNMFQKENKSSDIRESCASNSGHFTKNFIRIPADQKTYHTERWKCKSTSIYSPVCEDIMVNAQTVDQFSSLTGTFHIGDEEGHYNGSAQGHVLHLWRYDLTERQLFIARSFLFIDAQAYSYIRGQLDDL